MGDRYYQQRQKTGRKPFGDATTKANANVPPVRPEVDPYHKLSSTSPMPLPHNESIVPIGSLKVRAGDGNRSSGNRRIAKIAEEEGNVSKRDSACSNASTTASGSVGKRKSHIGPWQLGKTIGRGGCSRVRAVRHSITGQYGAAKIIEKSVAETVRAISLANLVQSAKAEGANEDTRMPVGLEREIVIMKLLRHRNIVQLFDVWENRNEIYLIMEYVQGGELFNYISDRRGLDEDEAVFLFRQIIAALLYCHRINIHHRDLKPENILLDRNTHELKLVDFGMAALQPDGKYLSTPCGSPHYAAPEVIKTKSYDGGKADVWSCGVILFVMLAGFPPFTYSGDERDLRELFRQIVHADYAMPGSFSKEAKDLIRRILVPDPRKRINIEQVWSHPLLRKYDKQLGYSDEDVRMENWVGATPTLDDWTPITREAIDKEILHNMRVLWHSEKVETLIRRLTSSEPNHEKYFYNALLKHRTQHLEDYAGLPGGVGYSSSDYHHDRTPTTEDAPPLPIHPRSKSTYSIMNNEHLYSKHSFYEPPVSDAMEYDPYRSSRVPITVDSKQSARVTVHRGSSDIVRKKARLNSSSLRVETLRKGSKRPNSARSLVASSIASRSNMSKRSSSVRHSIASSTRSVSRVSMTSSNWPSSPPIFSRPRPSYKRGVSFSHLRRSSAAGTWVTESVYIGDDTSHSLPMPTSPTSPTPVPKLSPKKVARTRQDVSPRKKSAIPAQGRLKVRKPGPTPTQYINQDVRKVSTELNQMCHDAFFRSSMDSSAPPSVSDKPSPYETPPSSASKRNLHVPHQATRYPPAKDKDAFQNRPLPPLPTDQSPRTKDRSPPSVETPHTFIAREIIETRDRIQRRSEVDDNSKYEEVLLYFDNMLIPQANKPGKRAVSAPYTKTTTEAPLTLPAISEEGRHNDVENKENRGYRSVTDPVTRQLTHWPNGLDPDKTIRAIPPSSPLVAPLNIRKTSAASSKSSNRDEKTEARSPIQPQPNFTFTSDTMTALPEAGHVGSGTSSVSNNGDRLDKPKTLKKKRSWLFGRKSEKEEKEKDGRRTPIPEAWLGLDDRQHEPPAVSTAIRTAPAKLTKQRAPLQDDASLASSEFPMRRNEPAPRGGFLRFFSRWTKHDPKIMEFESNDLSQTSINSVHSYTQTNDDVGRNNNKNNFDYERNWLSRFLHIKPATGTICLQVGRGRARQELIRTLRDWKKFGVRDIHFDRQKNLVSARVAKTNHLSIRPVSFVIELFVILEHGRRAQLCLARFTQTKGAASSFKKIMDVVEDVCNNKGLLVESEEQKKAMCEVLAI